MFSLCIGQIPCVFLCSGKIYKFSVFLERDFLWPFSMFSLCSRDSGHIQLSLKTINIP